MQTITFTESSRVPHTVTATAFRSSVEIRTLDFPQLGDVQEIFLNDDEAEQLLALLLQRKQRLVLPVIPEREEPVLMRN